MMMMKNLIIIGYNEHFSCPNQRPIFAYTQNASG